MQPIDYRRLLETRVAETFMPMGVAAAENAYYDRDGVQYRSQGSDGRRVLDMVRLSDAAFLLASDYSLEGDQAHRQIVNDSDWVHLQFRLNGGGREHVAPADVIETPEKSCVVVRYPKDSVIERESDPTDSWRVACLLVSPRGLTDLLDVPASRLPASVSWLALDDRQAFQSAILPLQPAMILAVNDILSCSFRGGTRRAYMRAKSLELLSTVVHALDSASTGSDRSGVKLSAFDLDKLSLARTIMSRELENALTLAQLARRVGLNRTKLALGFKEVYGTSVQAYWRDVKLVRARELLRDGGARVTEVALSLGYSELSSFTRAFSRKFGVLPRDCRNSTIQA